MRGGYGHRLGGVQRATAAAAYHRLGVKLPGQAGGLLDLPIVRLRRHPVEQPALDLRLLEQPLQLRGHSGARMARRPVTSKTRFTSPR